MTPVEAYFEVLVAVARSDGSVHEAEARVIRAALDGLGPSAQIRERIQELLDPTTPYDFDARLQHVTDSLDVSTLAETLRDAYVVAYIDGELHEVELGVVEKLFGALGIAAEAHASVHEWARRASAHHLEGLELLAEVLPAPRTPTAAAP